MEIKSWFFLPKSEQNLRWKRGRERGGGWRWSIYSYVAIFQFLSCPQTPLLYYIFLASELCSCFFSKSLSFITIEFSSKVISSAVFIFFSFRYVIFWWDCSSLNWWINLGLLQFMLALVGFPSWQQYLLITLLLKLKGAHSRKLRCH